jgi:hypothetical protein
VRCVSLWFRITTSQLRLTPAHLAEPLKLVDAGMISLFIRLPQPA